MTRRRGSFTTLVAVLAMTASSFAACSDEEQVRARPSSAAAGAAVVDTGDIVSRAGRPGVAISIKRLLSLMQEPSIKPSDVKREMAEGARVRLIAYKGGRSGLFFATFPTRNGGIAIYEPGAVTVAVPGDPDLPLPGVERSFISLHQDATRTALLGYTVPRHKRLTITLSHGRVRRYTIKNRTVVIGLPKSVSELSYRLTGTGIEPDKGTLRVGPPMGDGASAAAG